MRCAVALSECCIFHKQRRFDESSSDDSSDEEGAERMTDADEGEVEASQRAALRQPRHKHDGKCQHARDGDSADSNGQVDNS